ncbi:hypothetical protein PINS_up003476 [Pythium insidiosum]|nr:hypothetical protein PINS_up003476 [Pythium insidiosum]
MSKTLQERLRETSMTATSDRSPRRSYEPPLESAVLNTVALQRPATRFTDFSLSLSSTPPQDGYPPPFFKRLDKFIKENGFRAREVYMAIDHNSDGSVTVDELITGLNRIDFKISKKEERMLRDWMQQIVGHDLSFKEFSLALKQRASLTSPQRISILKLNKT